MLQVKERPYAPSDYSMAWILLRHKLFERNEIYCVSEFNIPGNRELDLSHYSTFAGLNVWTEEVARHSHKPALRWLILPAFLLIGWMMLRLLATLGLAAEDNRLLLREP
jgi:hypothetical protein